MKKIIPFLIISSFLLGACGAVGSPAVDAPPTTSPEDIYATANALAVEMMAETQAAMPTNTLIPPTNTPPSPPTATLFVPTIVLTPTEIVLPTATSASSSAPSCMDKQLTSWPGESAILTVTNNVSDTTANVFLCITTDKEDLGFINIPVGTSGSATVPLGCYSATAWVTGSKNFNATTTFCINRPSKMQLVIEKNQIYYRSGCAPNC